MNIRYKQTLQRNVLETIQTLLEHTILDDATQSLKVDVPNRHLTI